MQNEIKEPSDLLHKNGQLVQRGWARKLILKYNRENVKMGWHRIKEWDCYEIINPKFALILIIADVGYFGMATITWLDFEKKLVQNGLLLKLFTRGRLNLPPSSDTGDLHFSKKDAKMSFIREKEKRFLSVNYPGFSKGKGIKGEVTLYQDPDMDTMVNVIPFKDNKHFVYAQKINCMPAKGVVQIGQETYEFSEETSFSCLDWSRGTFPYRTSWYWGSASGLIDGKPFGFNIDYGFGDESIASKNMLFYEGKGHKLGEITFYIDRTDYMKPWKFTSNDGRFEMVMEPVLDNCSSLNILILKTSGHSMFGYFTGDVVLDSGERLHLDRFFGFAESDSHRW
jgi:hypothetical protein